MARSGRHVAQAGAVMVLGLALALGPVPVALADPQDITSQPYQSTAFFDPVAADTARAGQGVTLGVIAGSDYNYFPELEAAQKFYRHMDQTIGCPAGQAHDIQSMSVTNVVSVLGVPAWGWAPDASSVVLTRGPHDKCMSMGWGKLNDLAFNIHDALDRHAQVILIIDPGDGTPDPAFGYAVARAVAAGVPVVVAASDEGSTAFNPYAAVNGVIAVGGSTLTGAPVDWSPSGTGLTLVAPGTINGRDRDWQVAQVSSTGLAAAMVAGLLVRGVQIWPKATGNQLVAALIATASGHGTWDPRLGWGMIDPGAYLASDPTTYPDTNPLLGKMGTGPGADVLTAQMLQDYTAGTADPDPWIVPYGDNGYTDRHAAVLKAQAEAQARAHARLVRTVVGVGIGVVVLAAAGFFGMSWRRRHTTGTQSDATADGAASAPPDVVG